KSARHVAGQEGAVAQRVARACRILAAMVAIVAEDKRRGDPVQPTRQPEGSDDREQRVGKTPRSAFQRRSSGVTAAGTRRRRARSARSTRRRSRWGAG